jgi:hypothetical protein
MLQSEKLLFDWQSATVAGQFPVRTDYPVARNDNWYGIRAVGQPDRAAGFGITDAVRKLAIRDGLAIGNFQQLSPYKLLKGSAFWRERKIKGF